MASHVIFSLKLNTSKSNVHMKLTCGWNTHWWQRIQATDDRNPSLRSPYFISRQIYIFRTITSKIFGKQRDTSEACSAERTLVIVLMRSLQRRAHANNREYSLCWIGLCKYLIIITSEMIFIVFPAIFFPAIFEK
jgi:hypothetical protein